MIESRGSIEAQGVDVAFVDALHSLLSLSILDEGVNLLHPSVLVAANFFHRVACSCWSCIIVIESRGSTEEQWLTASVVGVRQFGCRNPFLMMVAICSALVCFPLDIWNRR